jgi:SRSO17 transposase
MTRTQLASLEPALADFLTRFRPSCRYAPTFDHLGTYVRGRLSELPRKTAEPIALATDTPVRTLQQFLTTSIWDESAVRASVQRAVADRLATLDGDDLGAIGLIDETSAVKQGTLTPGVRRQYLGCVGKVANGIVTVHLGVCAGRYKTLLDADLFLPEEWSDDRPRCREAGIPDDLVHRPTWALALDQLDRARSNGIRLNWLTFDAGYGKSPRFVRGLDDRTQRFVGEIPRTFACRIVPRSGDQPPPGLSGRPAEEVVRSAGVFRSQEWRVVRLARETTPDQVWRVKAGRVWMSSADGWSAGTYWLIWASSDQTGEEKYFLSNAPADVGVEVLVRVAFRRAGIEHAFRVCKSELGFGHFEGQSYRGLVRHLTLCLVSMAFVADRTDRLRGEKSGGHDGAGVPGVAAPDPGVDDRGSGDRGGGVGPGSHRVSPAAEPGRPGVPATETDYRAYAKKTATT